MEIKNIAFKDYVFLANKSTYNYAFRNGRFKSVDHFQIGDCQQLTFGMVKDMQYQLNSASMTWDDYFKHISDITGKKIKELTKLGIFTLHESRLHLRDMIDNISRMESDNLGHTPSQEEAAAGIEEFAKFGSWPQFRQLMQSLRLTKEQVEQSSYEYCFMELLYLSTEANFSKRLQAIYNNKH